MIHQLRIYRISPELKGAFDVRFRDHAARIMKSYGFSIKSAWFSELDDKMEFVYILEWPDEQTMRKQWQAFMSDSEWEEIKNKTRKESGEMVLAKVRDQVLTSVEWL